MSKVFENKALQDSKETLLRRLRGFANKIEEMSEEDFARYDKITNIFEQSMALAETDSYFADVENELHKENPENREVAIFTFIEDYGYHCLFNSKFSIK